MKKIDLNCDMGESFSQYVLGNDEEMMQYITSANIACGYHGGDPHVMRKTVRLAKEHQVKIGAHPGFPDLLGFGRRDMTATASEVKDYVTYQMGALREFARAEDIHLHHCKPHGALFMKAMRDRELARAILEAVHEADPQMVVFTLPQSEVYEQGQKMGVPVAKEAYADREHTKEGSIVMTRRGSAIKDYEQMAERVVRIVTEGRVVTNEGEDVSLEAETVCIHGDTPGAPQLAKAVTNALKEANVEITAIRNE
ncbi:LamB/YcsF family protein [Bacillus piscicola]|uniref:LamB/YcsF family protein n=1 Tax=Bacillus piscicola TaxID=1632684 RepID=UPI001F093540|nr:5-oxoprolinase subunit PxpA [Bacillus piscicola]